MEMSDAYLLTCLKWWQRGDFEKSQLYTQKYYFIFKTQFSSKEKNI